MPTQLQLDGTDTLTQAIWDLRARPDLQQASQRFVKAIHPELEAIVGAAFTKHVRNMRNRSWGTADKGDLSNSLWTVAYETAIRCVARWDPDKDPFLKYCRKSVANALADISYERAGRRSPRDRVVQALAARLRDGTPASELERAVRDDFVAAKLRAGRTVEEAHAALVKDGVAQHLNNLAELIAEARGTISIDRTDDAGERSLDVADPEPEVPSGIDAEHLDAVMRVAFGRTDDADAATMLTAVSSGGELTTAQTVRASAALARLTSPACQFAHLFHGLRRNYESPPAINDTRALLGARARPSRFWTQLDCRRRQSLDHGER